MKTTNEQNTKNHGITLIALIITIIVMLILVAVTVTMAVNGGLFEKAASAGRQTNEKRDQELEFAKGETIQDLINKYTATGADSDEEEIPDDPGDTNPGEPGEPGNTDEPNEYCELCYNEGFVYEFTCDTNSETIILGTNVVLYQEYFKCGGCNLVSFGNGYHSATCSMCLRGIYFDSDSQKFWCSACGTVCDDGGVGMAAWCNGCGSSSVVENR